MLSELKQRWWQLSAREQQLVGLMGGLLVMLVLWMAVVRPLFKAHQAAERRLAQAQAQWHWLNEQVMAHPALLQRQKKLTTQQLKSWLQGVLQQQGLSAQIEQTAQGISVRFKGSPAQVAALLDQLQRPEITLVQLKLEKISAHQVKASIILKGTA